MRASAATHRQQRRHRRGFGWHHTLRASIKHRHLRRSAPQTHSRSNLLHSAGFELQPMALGGELRQNERRRKVVRADVVYQRLQSGRVQRIHQFHCAYSVDLSGQPRPKEESTKQRKRNRIISVWSITSQATEEASITGKGRIPPLR